MTNEKPNDNGKVEAQAVAIAADELHKQWRDAYQAQNGEGAARWKPMKPASVDWVAQKGDVPADAIREGEKGQEINIAALPNSMLPPQFSGENTASAAGAIKAIKENKGADIDQLAGIVHEQWLERNGSWAAPELKKPYAELPEAEKEKDRIVVRVAESAISASAGMMKSVNPEVLAAAAQAGAGLNTAGIAGVETPRSNSAAPATPQAYQQVQKGGRS